MFSLKAKYKEAEGKFANKLLAATCCSLYVQIGEARVTYSDLYASYTVGVWLVRNWWRLLYETNKVEDKHRAEWEQAHKLSTLSDKYPDLCIYSVSPNIVTVTCSKDNSRYYVAITVQEFKDAINIFMRHLITHLDVKGYKQTEVHTAWSKIHKESSVGYVALYRQCEAQSSYTVDDCFDIALSSLFGENAEYAVR